MSGVEPLTYRLRITRYSTFLSFLNANIFMNLHMICRHGWTRFICSFCSLLPTLSHYVSRKIPTFLRTWRTHSFAYRKCPVFRRGSSPLKLTLPIPRPLPGPCIVSSRPLNTRFSAHKNLHLNFPLDGREGLRAPGDSILPTVMGVGFGSPLASRKHVSGSSGSRGIAFSLVRGPRLRLLQGPRL